MGLPSSHSYAMRVELIAEREPAGFLRKNDARAGVKGHEHQD